MLIVVILRYTCSQFQRKTNSVHMQGWAWDGTASPKDFCPWDLSPKAENPGTVPTIFVPVPRVPGICVPWDDFGTARILGTAWDSSPRDSPGILEFFIKTWFTHHISWILIAPKISRKSTYKIGTFTSYSGHTWPFLQIIFLPIDSIDMLKLGIQNFEGQMSNGFIWGHIFDFGLKIGSRWLI